MLPSGNRDGDFHKEAGIWSAVEKTPLFMGRDTSPYSIRITLKVEGFLRLEFPGPGAGSG